MNASALSSAWRRKVNAKVRRSQANCARSFELHQIPYYLHELVSLFHSYYNRHRVLSDDPDLTLARLFLASAIREVIRRALEILGVSAPEKM